MIPKLFNKDAVSFLSGELGDIFGATDIIAEEKVDDGHSWELSFTYPSTGPIFNELVNGRIIVAKANTYQDEQAFRIYSIRKKLNGSVEVKCQHISYDLNGIPVKPFTKFSCRESLEALKNNMVTTSTSMMFHFLTDVADQELPTGDDILPPKENPNVKKIDFEEPRSARSVLLDGEDSINGAFGGHIFINNFTIGIIDFDSGSLIYGDIGANRGVTIDYGVDLTDFDQEQAIDSMITGIMPYYVREKDIRIDLDLRTDSDVVSTSTELIDPADPSSYPKNSMVINQTEITLPASPKAEYTLTFTPAPDSLDNTGRARLNKASGFVPEGSDFIEFEVDGFEKKFTVIPTKDIVIPAGTVLIEATTLPSAESYYNESIGGITSYQPTAGAINGYQVIKNFVEPIVYTDPPMFGTYASTTARIESIDLTGYFQREKGEPTNEQLVAKAQEYLTKNKIGEPEVTLTVSRAPILDKDIRLYDIVTVNFVKMGVVTSGRVTRYRFNVYTERVEEIDIGKTKETLQAVLQDASRLKSGKISGRRIRDNSITQKKIAAGAVGSEQLGTNSISKWHIPKNSIDGELLSEKAITIDHLSIGKPTDKTKKKGNILNSVPDNVYGTYGGNVGYVFDPSLGIEWLQLPGWKDPQGHVIQPVKYHQDIPYNESGEYFPSGVPHAWGYMLDPNFIFDGSLDGDHKLENGSVTKAKIADEAIAEEKLANGSVTKAKIADEAITKEKLANGSVTIHKIANGSITREKLQDAGIDPSWLGSVMRAAWDDIAEKTAKFGKIIGPTFEEIEENNVTPGAGCFSMLQIKPNDHIAFPFISWLGEGTYKPYTISYGNSSVKVLATGPLSIPTPSTPWINSYSAKNLYINGHYVGRVLEPSGRNYNSIFVSIDFENQSVDVTTS